MKNKYKLIANLTKQSGKKVIKKKILKHKYVES